MRKSPSFFEKVTIAGAIFLSVATTSCKKIKAAIGLTNDPEKTEQITNISNKTNEQIVADCTNVATYNPDQQQKNNLEGGPDTNFTNALQSVVDKYQNSNEEYVKNVTKRFNALIGNLVNYDVVKANLLRDIKVCLTPNMVEDVRNARIAFYVDVINDLNKNGFEQAGHKIVLQPEITDNHFFLLATNPQYKENYNRAKQLFNAGARSTCAKIAGDGELTTNQKDAYLVSVYYSWLGAPQTWTTEVKRAFIGLYTGDVLVWKNASDEEVNEKFDELIALARDRMEKEDLTKIPMPVYVSEQDKKTYADVDF